jgi:exosortase H (IPTLxxWG-CTERM-specific)
MKDRITSSHGLRFVALGATLYAVLAFLPESVLAPLCRHTATMAVRLITLMGLTPTLAATVISQAGFSVDIVAECTSLGPSILFGAFVLTASVPYRQRIAGLLAGLPLLYLLNLLRIAAVFAIGLHMPGLFTAVHVYLGQVFMILAVLGLSLGWLRYVADDRLSGGIPFPLRALLYTVPLFLVWVRFNGMYVRLEDVLVRGLFTLFGYRLMIPYEHTLYYQTFNLVTFVALVLATRKSSMSRKLIALFTGSIVLMAGHLIMRICNVLMSAFGVTAALQPANFVAAIGQYLLPVLIWLLLFGWSRSAARSASDLPQQRSPLPWWR